jgi:hypothetical protein
MTEDILSEAAARVASGEVSSLALALAEMVREERMARARVDQIYAEARREMQEAVRKAQAKAK